MGMEPGRKQNMTDGKTIGADATTNGTDGARRPADDLAARIMARLRGVGLLAPEGGEDQDEFEARHLTPMIRDAIAQ